MIKKITLMITALMGMSAAHADITVNGFANLVMGQASEPVYGYDDDIDFSNESLFAVQLSSHINDSTTATAQLLSRGSDDYSVAFEWAYLTHTFSPSSQISAGRLRLPLYRYSASRDVGYSYHFITAPAAVYDTPYNNIDGVRYQYKSFSGNIDYNLQVAAGHSQGETERNGNVSQIDISDILLVSAEAGYHNLRGRIVYATADVTISSAPLNAGTSLIAQVNEPLADLLRAEDDPGVFFGVGANYDNGQLFVAAEYTYNDLEDSFHPTLNSYYVTAGLRKDKWTPFIVYEHADRQGNVLYTNQVALLPPPVQTQIAPLVTGIQAGAMYDNRAATLGVRYDWDEGIAIKADVTRHEDRLNAQNNSTLSRIAVNYVF